MLQIFASAMGHLLAYAAVFVTLRFRVGQCRNMSAGKVELVTHQESTPRSESSLMLRLKKEASSTASPNGRPSTGEIVARKISDTSLTMLAYPVVNLIVLLPLSVYRISELAGHRGSPQLLAACGFVFSLGGFANVMIYSLTRVNVG